MITYKYKLYSSKKNKRLDRDVHAAKNILRRGIYELGSGSKTTEATASRRSTLATPRIPRALAVGVCQKVLGKALMEEHRLGVKLITNHDEIEKALKLIDKICR